MSKFPLSCPIAGAMLLVFALSAAAQPAPSSAAAGCDAALGRPIRSSGVISPPTRRPVLRIRSGQTVRIDTVSMAA